MFELIRFAENPITHSVDVIVKYEWKDGVEQRIQKEFGETQQARIWLNQQRKLYGHAKLVAYVTHKKILSETSYCWSIPENRMEKLNALTLCIRETDAVKDYPLWSLAKLIETMYPQLVLILPMPNNLHYKKAKIILHDLWIFAQEVINPKGKWLPHPDQTSTIS